MMGDIFQGSSARAESPRKVQRSHSERQYRNGSPVSRVLYGDKRAVVRLANEDVKNRIGARTAEKHTPTASIIARVAVGKREDRSLVRTFTCGLVQDRRASDHLIAKCELLHYAAALCRLLR